jgi:hypothetical protein
MSGSDHKYMDLLLQEGKMAREVKGNSGEGKSISKSKGRANLNSQIKKKPQEHK